MPQKGGTISKMMVAESTDTVVPLRSWIEDEAKKIKGDQSDRRKQKEVFVRVTTVAYGIAELLKVVVEGGPNGNGLLEKEVQIENFCVYVGQEPNSPQHLWDDINGISMISTGASLTMLEPSYLSCLLSEEEKGGQMGRYLEVELESMPEDSPPAQGAAAEAADDDKRRCHLFARLLYELFSHQPFPDDDDACTRINNGDDLSKEPAHKKTKVDHLPSRKELMLSRARGDFDNKADSTPDSTFERFARKMQKLGIPVSICLMTQNLLESALKDKSDAYSSLRVVCEDLHLLLLDPDRFLFDKEVEEHENVQLLYRKEKLYGRDKEESLITDAFCRVSRGKSEAFFIGGFSGSGKSKLVNSLRAKVDAVGGYVLTHKYDDVSKEMPLFGVVSALNQLCLMITDRNTPEAVLAIASKLKDVFGDDCWLLASLLPNISLLSSEFSVKGKRACETMNLRSVCFTLLRFVRVVSSPVHPIMVCFVATLLTMLLLLCTNSHTNCYVVLNYSCS